VAINDFSDTVLTRRTRRTRPYPAFALEDSLIVPQAIYDFNAGKPFSRLTLADSIRRSPGSSQFRDLIVSSTTYGITEGSYNATHISLTDLGRSIVMPTHDDERSRGLLEASMRVDLLRRLYEHFDQHKIPAPQILNNILVRQFDVDPELAEGCVERFLADGRFVGLIRTIAGAEMVSIHDATGIRDRTTPIQASGVVESPPIDTQIASTARPDKDVAGTVSDAPKVRDVNNRVFITHGKNREVVEQLKQILRFGKFEPVVAEDHETLVKPVPQIAESLPY
jgi:hypothetical protein